MPEVLIAIGSNLGDRLAFLQEGLEALRGEIRWTAVSQVYETAPMYVEDQPPYLNAAARGETGLGPLALLDLLKRTEKQIGRHISQKFGPREIDLDLIAFGRLQLQSTRRERSLTLPHPRAAERRFVLAPLADVAPEWLLPGFGRVDELLEATNAQAGDVKILGNAVLSIHGHRR